MADLPDATWCWFWSRQQRDAVRRLRLVGGAGDVTEGCAIYLSAAYDGSRPVWTNWAGHSNFSVRAPPVALRRLRVQRHRTDSDAPMTAPTGMLRAITRRRCRVHRRCSRYRAKHHRALGHDNDRDSECRRNPRPGMGGVSCRRLVLLGLGGRQQQNPRRGLRMARAWVAHIAFDRNLARGDRRRDRGREPAYMGEEIVLLAKIRPVAQARITMQLTDDSGMAAAVSP